MYRFFLTALCFVLINCAGNREANQTAGEANAEIFQVENESLAHKHFFWKVSDENSSVWVLGSVHFADTSFYPMDSVIEDAFANAEELAVEMNITDDSVSHEVVQNSVQKGLFPQDSALSMVLPRSVWNSLDSLCAAWNFPIAGLMRLRPWYAATTLSAIALQRTGIDASLGVDVVLLDRAADEGKNIVALETAEEQITAVAGDGSSDSSGVYYLKSTLREIADLDSMVARLIRAWKTGDEVLLRQVMNDNSASDSADSLLQEQLEERIYTSRNGKMTKSIGRFLAEDRNVFVVVGVAHLMLDDNNVIDLLKKQGYKVERF